MGKGAQNRQPGGVTLRDCNTYGAMMSRGTHACLSPAQVPCRQAKYQFNQWLDSKVSKLSNNRTEPEAGREIPSPKVLDHKGVP